MSKEVKDNEQEVSEATQTLTQQVYNAIKETSGSVLC